MLTLRIQGLGTSDNKDAQNYFSHMEKHMIPFAALDAPDKELIELAFSKKKADARKEWLRQLEVRELSGSLRPN